MKLSLRGEYALRALVVLGLNYSDEVLRMAEAGEPLIYEVGLEPTERTMRSAVGLVWRLVIAWMALLLMLTIALWLG